MVAADNIRDEPSLAEWLEVRSPRYAARVANRAAMRLAPLVWVSPVVLSDGSEDATTGPMLLALVLSQAASGRPDERIWAKAEFAYDLALFAADQMSVMSRVGDRVLHSAALAAMAAGGQPERHIIECALGAVNQAFLAGYDLSKAPDLTVVGNMADPMAVWAHVSRDALAVEDGAPPGALWEGANPLQATWEDVRAKWKSAGSGWQFWIDWYEDALAGREPNWALMHDIALINDSIWEAGTEAVNAEIARLRTERGIAQSYNAERIEQNPETGRLRLVPETDLPVELAAAARRKMRAALDLFDGDAGNLYTALAPVRRRLQRAVAETGNMPLELFDACASASRMTVHFGKEGSCPVPDKDPLLSEFLHLVREAGADILANDPTTQKVIELRRSVLGGSTLIEHRDAVTAAAQIAAEVSEGALPALVIRDAELATDGTVPAEERAEASYRFGSRMLRIAKIGIACARGAGSFVIGGQRFLEACHKLVTHPWVQKAIQAILGYFGL